MKSYYGNLVVDIFELIFAIVALFLVWISSTRDTIEFFGISTIVYMLPRFLTIVLGISNNSRDIIRLSFDVVSLITLFFSFVLVCFLMFNEIKPVLPEEFTIDNFFVCFYVISGISLSDTIYKCLIGLVRKFSLTIENHKCKLF